MAIECYRKECEFHCKEDEPFCFEDECKKPNWKAERLAKKIYDLLNPCMKKDKCSVGNFSNDFLFATKDGMKSPTGVIEAISFILMEK
jgi:hypothetical protein